MKIVHITDGMPPKVLGGTGAIVQSMVTSLRENGHEVWTISFSDTPHVDGFDIRLPSRKKRFAHYRSVCSKKNSADILQQLQHIQPDVIHMHTVAFQAGYRWIPRAHAMGIPVIALVHDVMNVACGRVTGFETRLWLKDIRRCRWEWNPFRTAIIRKIFNTYVSVYTVSDALRLFMEKNGFKNLTTMHNSIDVDFWKPESRKDARTKLNLPADVPLFLLAGRLGVDKGTELIQKTLPKNAHLIVAGRADLSSFKSIKDRMHYFPHQNQEQMRTLYAACTASLVPSLCLDCFPTICLESMSCGRSILATSWGGSKEAVSEECGWVLEPQDKNAWAMQMQWCVDNPKKTDEYGSRAREHAVKAFNLKDYVERLEKLYRDTRKPSTEH